MLDGGIKPPNSVNTARTLVKLSHAAMVTVFYSVSAHLCQGPKVERYSSFNASTLQMLLARGCQVLRFGCRGIARGTKGA